MPDHYSAMDISSIASPAAATGIDSAATAIDDSLINSTNNLVAIEADILDGSLGGTVNTLA